MLRICILYVLISTHSDHRFNLLFRAVDTIGGDGLVGEEDLVEFMFPSEPTSVTTLSEVRRLELQHGHEHGQHNHDHRHHIHTTTGNNINTVIITL